MYFPKSQIITDLTTNGSEFILADSGKSYVGFYFSTYNNKYYTGKTPQDGITSLLIPISPPNKSNKNTLTIPSNPVISRNYNPPGYINSSSTPILPPPPKSNIVLPTLGDYETGEYQRYFLNHNTTNLYLEINNHTYNNFKNKNKNSQYQLYKPIVINWVLAGKPIETYEVNKNIVSLYQKQNFLNGFSNFFKGRYLKYYKPNIKQYFSTTGGELKVKDTEENYVGFYHVFPTRGVIMEGRFHSPSPHNILIPFKGKKEDKNLSISILDREVGTSIRKNISRGSGY